MASNDLVKAAFGGLRIINQAAKENRSLTPEENKQILEGVRGAENNFFKELKNEGNSIGDHPNDPQWLYTHWNWNAWPIQAQDYWIKKWKATHPTDYKVLYSLLLDNQGDYYYINNFISHHNDTGPYSYTNIPNPSGPLAKLQPDYYKNFYENVVPYAGAFVRWFLQINQNLIYGPDLTGYKFKVYTTSPSTWFEIKATNLGNDLGGSLGIGFGSGLLTAAVVVGGVLYLSSK